MNLSPFAPTWALLRRLSGRAPALAAAWLRWFWRLSIPGKLAATALELIALDLLLGWLPLPAPTRQELLTLAGLALAFLLVGSLLVGGRR